MKPLNIIELIEEAIDGSGISPRGPNFRAGYSDAILAIAEIEGLDSTGNYSDDLASQWLDAQDSPSAKGSAAAARTKLRQAMAMHVGPITGVYGSEHVATVMGRNGIQRYYITLNGQVLFPTQYASSGAAIQKAKEKGLGLK